MLERSYFPIITCILFADCVNFFLFLIYIYNFFLGQGSSIIDVEESCILIIVLLDLLACIIIYYMI